MRLAIVALLCAGCDDALIIYGFCGHTNRIKIDFAATVPVTTDLPRFPLLVRIAGAELTETESIEFFENGSCDPLPYEIETFVPGTGELTAWVGVTSGPIYLAFGGKNGDPRSEEVFMKYRGVWHFSDARDAKDSSPYSITGILDGSHAPGIAGNAVEIGPGDLVDFGDEDHYDFHADDSFSFGAWIDRESVTNTWMEPIQKGGNNGDVQGYLIETSPTGDQIYACLSQGDQSNFTECQARESSPPLEGGWTYFVAVVDRATEVMTLYKNGAPTQTYDVARIDPDPPEKRNDMPLQVGSQAYPFPGKVDEFRIIHQALTREWLSLEYESQRPDSSLLVVGEVESIPQ
jgi:hypothetical protein